MKNKVVVVSMLLMLGSLPFVWLDAPAQLSSTSWPKWMRGNESNGRATFQGFSSTLNLNGFGGNIAYSSPSVGLNNRVYATGYNGGPVLDAFDIVGSTLQFAWGVSLGNVATSVSEPSIDVNGDIWMAAVYQYFYFADGRLLRVNGTTHAVDYISVGSPFAQTGPPAIGPDGTVYWCTVGLSGGGATLFAVKPSSPLQLKWLWTPKRRLPGDPPETDPQTFPGRLFAPVVVPDSSGGAYIYVAGMWEHYGTPSTLFSVFAKLHDTPTSTSPAVIFDVEMDDTDTGFRYHDGDTALSNDGQKVYVLANTGYTDPGAPSAVLDARSAADGSLIRSQSIERAARRGVCITALGNVVVGGSIIRKFNADLTTLWNSWSFPGGDMPTADTPSSPGMESNIYVVRNSSETTTPAVIVIRPDGSLLTLDMPETPPSGTVSLASGTRAVVSTTNGLALLSGD